MSYIHGLAALIIIDLNCDQSKELENILVKNGMVKKNLELCVPAFSNNKKVQISKKEEEEVLDFLKTIVNDLEENLNIIYKKYRDNQVGVEYYINTFSRYVAIETLLSVNDSKWINFTQIGSFFMLK